MLRTTVGGIIEAILVNKNAARRIGIEVVGRQAWGRGAMASPVPFRAMHTMNTTAARTLGRNTSRLNPAWRAAREQNWAQPLRRRFHTTKGRRNAQGEPGAQAKEPEPTTLSARMKKLSKEYGWVAVGVYFGLSFLDFPFCFLLVRMVGTDRISELEHWVLSYAEKVVPQSVKDFWHKYRQAAKDKEKEHLGNNDISHDVEMVGWGVKEAEERNKEEASLATQLALAYAIHKSFIFLRVPLAAAVTPKVVKVLRGMGWQIGKKAAR